MGKPRHQEHWHQSAVVAGGTDEGGGAGGFIGAVNYLKTDKDSIPQWNCPNGIAPMELLIGLNVSSRCFRLKTEIIF